MIGCAAIGVVLAGALLALIGWGGITVVPGASPSAAVPAATRALRVGGTGPGIIVPAGTLLAVPVAGVGRAMITDSWADPRDNGQRPHHGTDIIAPARALVTAAAPGFVEKLWTSRAGGTTLYVRSPNRRLVYYYAHLSDYAPGIREGLAVRTGDPLGYVGDTGNAGTGNFHLHFGISLTTPAQRWYQGIDIDPYPLLAGKPVPR